MTKTVERSGHDALLPEEPFHLEEFRIRRLWMGGVSNRARPSIIRAFSEAGADDLLVVKFGSSFLDVFDKPSTHERLVEVLRTLANKLSPNEVLAGISLVETSSRACQSFRELWNGVCERRQAQYEEGEVVPPSTDFWSPLDQVDTARGQLVAILNNSPRIGK